jgi:hypothetical protein
VEDAPKKMSLALAFETAMVDAINVYVREVLKPRGCLTLEGFDRHVSDECLKEKYRIVREWAAKWAVFDGYEREPPDQQSQPGPAAARDPAT